MNHATTSSFLLLGSLICSSTAVADEISDRITDSFTELTDIAKPLRLDASLIIQTRTHVTQSVSNIVAPAIYRFDGVALGLNIDAEYEVNELWSVEAKGRATHFPFFTDSTLTSLGVTGLSAGAIRHHELAGYRVRALGGLAKVDTYVSLYADSAHQNIASVAKSIYGMYVGIGFSIPTPAGELVVEAGGVISIAGIVPSPIESWVSLEAQISDPTGLIPEGWDAVLGYDYTYRSLAYSINDINSRVFEDLHALSFGMTKEF
jgi:hypothetical protein